MKISNTGIELIKFFEGWRLKPYYDPVGIATCGAGHTKIAQELMDAGITLTEEQGLKLLDYDLIDASEAVNDNVRITLTQNQFDALVSFAFNLGCGNLAKSTLLKKLNASDYAGAAEQFLVWNKAGGKVLPGLTKRRAAEKALFLGLNWKEAAK